MAEKNPDRGRNFWFIVYPDSAPENWIDVLEGNLDYCDIPTAISPLHQPDKDSENEEEKRKPHYHVFVQFSGDKSRKQIDDLYQPLLNCTKCKKINNPIGAFKYLIHKGKKTKEQFENGYDAITCINSFDKDKYIELAEIKQSMLIDIINLIENENILGMRQLTLFLLGYDVSLLEYLKDNTYFFQTFLSSRRAEIKQ